MEPSLRAPPHTPPIKISPPHVSKEISKLPGRGSGETDLPLGATAVCDQPDKDRSLQAQEKVPRYLSRRSPSGSAQLNQGGGHPAEPLHQSNLFESSPRGGGSLEPVQRQRQPNRATSANGSTPMPRPSAAPPDRGAGLLGTEPTPNHRIGPLARGARVSTRTSTSMQGNADLGHDAFERIVQPARFMDQPMADSPGSTSPASTQQLGPGF